MYDALAGGADIDFQCLRFSEAEWGYNGAVSYPPRYYGENDLHFLTTSTYRRTQIFNSELFKREFIETLAELRTELGFRLLGYVLMPEHFHLLVWPSPAANPSLAPVISSG
jgi:REP element-mobilizing transposase RayT